MSLRVAKQITVGALNAAVGTELSVPCGSAAVAAGRFYLAVVKGPRRRHGCWQASQESLSGRRSNGG